MSTSPSPLLSARGSRLALLVVGLCWLAVLFDGLDMFIYGSVLPHLLETRTFGLTADQAGDLGSYATFGMLVGALVAGTIADRIGRKKLMVFIGIAALRSSQRTATDGERELVAAH